MKNNQIKIFFSDIDSSIYNNPTKLAQEYLYFLITKNKQNLIKDSNSIFITIDDNNLSNITKRCFLISDGLSLSCKSSKSIRIGVDYTTNPEQAIGYYAFNNNLYKLGQWIKKSKSLLIEGKLAYFPNTYKHEFNVDSFKNGYFDMDVKPLTDFTNISDVLIKNHKITSITNNPTNKFIEPVLTLDIPVVDTTDLEDFSNIILESQEAIDSFQNHLKSSILSIDRTSKDEIEKLSYDLKLQLKDINNRYNKVISQYHISNAISCIGLATAMLFIVSPDISELIKVGMGTGITCGLIPFLKSTGNFFIEKDMSDSPNYFLWILQEK